MSKVAKAKAALPAGVKIVGGQEVPLDAPSIRKVMEGWRIKQMIDEAQEQLRQINAWLFEAHGAGCALVVTGICRASLAERQTVRVTDPGRLEAVLGARMADLVSARVSYTATDRLVEMASDGDEPLQPAIAACLTVSESPVVSWRAER